MNTIEQKQFLPISLQAAWDFFATPKNLNLITPKDLTFEITSEVPDKMHEGLLITYVIRPIFNIPFKWQTKISHLKKGVFFIDKQLKGPYRIWHHEHYFKEVEGGVMMTDIVYYDIGKSFLGKIIGKLFVHKKVKEIFNYRYRMLQSYFSKTQ